MSQERELYDLVFNIYVGSEKTFFITIIDPATAEAKDLTNVNIYATGKFSIITPSGLSIATMDIIYSDRIKGVISFTVLDEVTTAVNAGNWRGHLQLINNTSTIVEQQLTNFNIIAI